MFLVVKMIKLPQENQSNPPTKASASLALYSHHQITTKRYRENKEQMFMIMMIVDRRGGKLKMMKSNLGESVE